MNEPDFEPKTAWRLYLLPALAFILALLLIALAAMQAPAMAEAADWTPAPPSVAAMVDDFDAPNIPGQEIRIGRCPAASADAEPAWMAGCTWAVPEPMPIYITDPSDRWSLAHEYGHRFMGVAMAGFGVAHLQRILRYQSPLRVYGERAADIYASCALEMVPRKHRANGLDQIDSEFPTPNGYQPSRAEQARACAWLWRIGERAGLR